MTKNFTPGANTYAPGNVPLAVSVVDPVQVLSADGAITMLSGLISITKASAAAITLAIPDMDGQRLRIVSESAFAHTITTVSPGFNNNSSFTVITMAPQAGGAIILESRNGVWWVVEGDANSNLLNNVQVITGDGAIAIKTGLVVLTKGSAAAITIADPTAGIDDGATLVVVTTTAQAHVITDSTSGFNAKGSSGTATFTAAIGNAVTLAAYNGKWYSVVKTGVTIA